MGELHRDYYLHADRSWLQERDFVDKTGKVASTEYCC